MSNKIQVEMPDWFLLTIAVHGDMGSGDLSDLMQSWAREQCEKHGLGKRLRELQEENIAELRKRIANVLGRNAVEQLERDIDEAVSIIKAVEGTET